MNVTALSLAHRYLGIKERDGDRDHPLIVWWLSLCGFPESHDEVPWCSAFVNGVAWELYLPRSYSAMARSWLAVGSLVAPAHAVPGWDVVVLSRGPGEQPGPEVLDAPGHVGFFLGWETERGYRTRARIIAGNQSNEVSIRSFAASRVLGIRRLRQTTN